jgi:hypothetical protein
VGLINIKGEKVSIPINHKLANLSSIEEKENSCSACGQNKSACEEIKVSETYKILELGGGAYTQTTTKKMHPNGDYYLETKTPTLKLGSDEIVYVIDKKFIANIKIKTCGCINEAPENLNIVRDCCEEVYYKYFTAIAPSCTSDIGSYQIFEESGLIQLSHNFRFSKVYLEYAGFMPKINGQYYVPRVCFEALVEWTKWKSIANRRGVERWRILDQKDNYLTERKNMNINLNLISLNTIIDAVGLTPKFNLNVSISKSCCSLQKTNNNATSIEDGNYAIPLIDGGAADTENYSLQLNAGEI